MRARLTLLAVVLAVTALLAAPGAGAHTEVQRATPGPAEALDGTVDSVVLDFLDPVQPTPELTVSGPDGRPVPGLGQPRLIADDVVEVSFDALTEAGDYQVDYTFTSLDGDRQSDAYRFSFEPDSGWALELRPTLAALVGVALVALAGWALLDRRRQTRLDAADHR
ncbi:MAG TPA: copper resistance protein CopC [Acidimicrobiales bacterium]|nr:copper resistance protein CopC [Acidimicrobiales bacterium]